MPLRSQADITILIPTLNRSDFVRRLLRYYHAVQFKGVVCVVDASGPEHVNRVAPVVEELASSVRIQYVSLPGSSDSGAVKHAADVATTAYAVFTGDDDFLVPSVLDLCVAALEQDPGLSAVHGSGVVAVTDGEGAYRPVVEVRPYRQPALSAPTARQRVLDHLGDYSVSLFAVQPVALWRAMYRDVLSIGNRTLEEIYLSCFSAVRGRILALPELGLVRQDHTARFPLPRGFDWIATPGWAESYSVFSRLLTEQIARQDSIPVTDAEPLARQAFWAYLAKLLDRHWQATFGESLRPPSSTGRWWQRGASVGRRVIRRLAGSETRLRQLRRESSRDYRAFDAVFRAMTEMSR